MSDGIESALGRSVSQSVVCVHVHVFRRMSVFLSLPLCLSLTLPFERLTL